VPGDGRYLTDVFTSEAIGFIDSCRGEPFFLHLAYNAPHSPLQAPEELVARYRAHDLNPAVATLYAMIERMDSGIGQVIKKLEAGDLLDNTIIVFTSDNGPWLGQEQLDDEAYSMARYNGPFRGMKQDVLEGGIRVPAMVRWGDGLPAGRVCNDVLHGGDWLPTLLSACGGTPSGLPLDGLDRLGGLRGDEAGARPPCFWQFNRYDPVRGCNMAMREEDWKLYWPRIAEAMLKEKADSEAYRENFRGPHRLMPVDNPPVDRRVPEPHAPELYDIACDPGEADNVAAEHADDVARLVRAAEAWFDDVEGERRANTCGGGGDNG
jgi:arylsulfatase A